MKDSPQKKADNSFSEYIRTRDACDHTGYIICPICGISIHWKNSDCMHFIKRGKNIILRLDERNAVAGCKPCNNRDSDEDLIKVASKIIDLFGEGIIGILASIKNNINHLSIKDYEEIESYYKLKAKKIRKDKGI